MVEAVRSGCSPGQKRPGAVVAGPFGSWVDHKVLRVQLGDPCSPSGTSPVGRNYSVLPSSLVPEGKNRWTDTGRVENRTMRRGGLLTGSHAKALARWNWAVC